MPELHDVLEEVESKREGVLPADSSPSLRTSALASLGDSEGMGGAGHRDSVAPLPTTRCARGEISISSYMGCQMTGRQSHNGLVHGHTARNEGLGADEAFSMHGGTSWGHSRALSTVPPLSACSLLSVLCPLLAPLPHRELFL